MDGAKTPSSIASSPREGLERDCDRNPSTPHAAALCLETVETPPPSKPHMSHALHDLWVAARSTRRDTDGLHRVLKLIHDHVIDLQQELVTVTQEMKRQQQAYEIAILEKDCQIRLAQSEATAYSMAATARVAAVATLQKAVDMLREEKRTVESTHATMNDLLTSKLAALDQSESELKSSTTRISQLEEELKSMTEKTFRNEQLVASLNASLETARADAASAAGQLVDACDENARLSDALSEVQMALEKKDDHIAELQQELMEQQQKQQQRQENDSLSSSLHHQHGLRSRPFLMNSNPLALTHVHPDPEDLLAVEVSHLRGQTKELEMELAQARESKPILAALERENDALRQENTALKIAADQAQRDSQTARKELGQVQAEARVLYGQLSEVIEIMAQDNNDNENNSRAKNETVHSVETSSSSAAQSIEFRKNKDNTTAITNNDAILGWRNGVGGPPTPTWETPPSVSSARRMTSGGGGESDSGSDLILAEIRSAMASLDIKHPLNNTTQQMSPSLPVTTTADILMSINQGLATLGHIVSDVDENRDTVDIQDTMTTRVQTSHEEGTASTVKP